MSEEPAYPHTCDGVECCGLTKREWFAGMALQGLLACPDCEMTREEMVTYSIQSVDELIKQLKDQPNG